MKIEGRDVARIAVFIAGERVDDVRNAVREGLRRLEGRVGQEGGIVGYFRREIGRTKRLRR